MTLQIFKESFCKVTPFEGKGFGMYPFPMVCLDDKGGMNVYSLALDKVQEYYNVFAKVLFEGNKVIHMAVDFPAKTGDFLMVLSYFDGEYSYEVLPYHSTTGIFIKPTVEIDELSKLIFSQFKQHILEIWKRKS